MLLAASVQAGYSSYQTSNTLLVGTLQGLASNSTGIWTAGMKLRAAYEFTFDSWYLRPYVDLDLLHSAMPGYTFATNGMSIQSDAISHWAGVVEPVLEVGSRFNVGSDAWLRPFASVSGTFFANNRITTRATFSDGLLNGITFNATEALPNALLDLGGGVQFMSGDTYELRAQYRAQMGNDFLIRSSACAPPTGFDRTRAVLSVIDRHGLPFPVPEVGLAFLPIAGQGEALARHGAVGLEMPADGANHEASPANQTSQPMSGNSAVIIAAASRGERLRLLFGADDPGHLHIGWR